MHICQEILNAFVLKYKAFPNDMTTGASLISPLKEDTKSHILLKLEKPYCC